MLKYAFWMLLFLLGTGCASDTYYLQDGEKRYLTPLEPGFEGEAGTDYYRTERGGVVGVTDRLLLSLEPGTTLDTYLERYGLMLLKELGGGLYLLQTPSRAQTIPLANALSAEPGVAFAQPDFEKRAVRR